jgi:DNA-binding NtrC family response regulator
LFTLFRQQSSLFRLTRSTFMSPARFLLVDDDAAEAAELAAAIEARIGLAHVMLAANGRQAADLLRGGPPDVLLMDVASLLDLSPRAEEAVSRLVKLADEALAVALSNAASVSAAVEVMRAGAHDCISRPVSPEALVQRVAALARRHGKAPLPGMGPQPAAELLGHEPAGRRLPRQPILPLWKQEQRIIEEAIARFSGNVALAAAALELSPSTIYRKRQAWAEMDGKKGAA